MKKILFFLMVLLLVININCTSSYAKDMYNDEYIKVKLQRPIKSNNCISLKSENGFVISSFDGYLKEMDKLIVNEIILTLGDNDSISIKDKNDYILYSFGNNDNIYISSIDEFEPIVKVENDSYRDYLTFVRNENKIDVINYVSLNHYLYGVVSREMPSTFPLESLKAQAIASRTFALKNMNKHIKEGYNLCDSTDCQVYGGYDSETEITNRAVDETSGIVLKYNNELIEASYHSNSGGYTEDSSNVWGTSYPYLRAVEDEFSIGLPNSNWQIILSSSDIRNKLLKNNINIGDIISLNSIEISENGRVVKLKIVGTKGEIVLEKDKIRQVFGYSDIKSNWFDIRKIDGNNLDNVIEEVYVMDAIKTVKIKLNDSYATSGEKAKIFSNREGFKRIVTDKGIEDINKAQALNGSPQFVIEGKGYGHGVGMSQWGAKKMGELGYTHDEILKHYYSGVELTTLY
ncbi:SpoIID/LytB domain-containing protein [Sporanaerobacter acetigenes]|uniref:Stage II sporulation protein D n=1 Tax=Sporanaerobacter acetigenes DSM 13106 TaxID=1123281 RepID=A0A1M5XUM5_9FIRM|nr:SpoIID/LytB domain-containing protein [Sporanaerobacter acetigenes]SHI03238.1 stage II sporulation protein D [Sporanaerobacter acetigenes DSM 13106]